MENAPHDRTRMRFSITSLLVLMAMVAIAASVVGGLWRAGVDRETFVLWSIAAPVGVLLLAVGASEVRRFLRNR